MLGGGEECTAAPDWEPEKEGENSVFLAGTTATYCPAGRMSPPDVSAATLMLRKPSDSRKGTSRKAGADDKRQHSRQLQGIDKRGLARTKRRIRNDEKRGGSRSRNEDKKKPLAY
jgi:hypothetical protein